jgi:hypothetical protein
MWHDIQNPPSSPSKQIHAEIHFLPPPMHPCSLTMNYIAYFIRLVPPVSTIKPEDGDYYPFLLNLNSAMTCTSESHHSSGTAS